jgi:pimeloyl-ACP methyl ester carboxylesterase
MTGRSGYARAPDGVRIAWRLDGPQDAPAVVLCTMGTAALSVWDGLTASLTDRWCVLRHDRRGEGDSDPGTPQSHRFATYAEDAFRIMDLCGLPLAHVVGMAFGARVAVRMALDGPARVRSLTLFDATAGAPAPESVRRAQSAVAARLWAAAGLPRIVADPRWFARRDPGGARLALHALAAETAWTAGLETISAPTLIACGEQDPNFGGAVQMSREIPEARFEAMPMTGHGSILDRPDLVASLLRGFLEAVEDAPGGR